MPTTGDLTMSKEKVIIKALPERFDEIEKQGNMSIEEKYALFSQKIRKAFDPIIKQIAESEIREIEKAIPKYKDVEKKEKLPMSLVIKITSWLDTPKEDRPKLAIKWATDILNPEIWKTEGKLILLENAKLEYYYNNEFKLSGTVFGSSVYIKQQVVFKRSIIGNDFVQFPARIYLDGKFTPEDVYKSWFREKGEGIFKDIEDIRSKIRAEISFKIGSLYLTEVKRKQKELQNGMLPFMVHQVIAVDKDFLTVRPLKVNRYMIKGDRNSHYRYKIFDAIYRWSPDIFDGESEKWEVQSTPTKSRLIGRRNTSKVNYNSIRRDYNKQWRKWTPTHAIPSLPTEEDVIWQKSKKGYETTIMGKVFDLSLVPFTNMGWDNKEVKGITSRLGIKSKAYFDIAPDSEYAFKVVSTRAFDPKDHIEELLKNTTKGILKEIFDKETEDLAKRLEEGEDHE